MYRTKPAILNWGLKEISRFKMGGTYSSRATHFQNPASEPISDGDNAPVEQHISISNKMVERLVEDANLAGGAAAVAVTVSATPRGDFKDKIYIEKLRCMDDSHSERCGLTVEDINAIAARVDFRTANMVSVEPVCADCKERVIQCYNETRDTNEFVECWNTVGDFTKCVQDASMSRIRARTQKEAREYARRTRHVAHAREHALKDLGPRQLAEGTAS